MHDGVIYRGMILMTRKYVENWLLWVIINVLASLFLHFRAFTPCLWSTSSDLYCPQRQPDVDQKRTRKRSRALSH